MGNIPKVSSHQSNPNIPSQQVNPNTQQGSIKTRRRIITTLAFILPIIFVLQYSLNNQQEMIKENKSHLIRNNKIIFCKEGWSFP